MCAPDTTPSVKIFPAGAAALAAPAATAPWYKAAGALSGGGASAPPVTFKLVAPPLHCCAVPKDVAHLCVEDGASIMLAKALAVPNETAKRHKKNFIFYSVQSIYLSEISSSLLMEKYLAAWCYGSLTVNKSGFQANTKMQ
jgi:hypothetical protein